MWWFGVLFHSNWRLVSPWQTHWTIISIESCREGWFIYSDLLPDHFRFPILSFLCVASSIIFHSSVEWIHFLDYLNLNVVVQCSIVRWRNVFFSNYSMLSHRISNARIRFLFSQRMASAHRQSISNTKRPYWFAPMPKTSLVQQWHTEIAKLMMKWHLRSNIDYSFCFVWMNWWIGQNSKHTIYANLEIWSAFRAVEIRFIYFHFLVVVTFKWCAAWGWPTPNAYPFVKAE